MHCSVERSAYGTPKTIVLEIALVLTRLDAEPYYPFRGEGSPEGSRSQAFLGRGCLDDIRGRSWSYH